MYMKYRLHILKINRKHHARLNVYLITNIFMLHIFTYYNQRSISIQIVEVYIYYSYHWLGNVRNERVLSIKNMKVTLYRQKHLIFPSGQN
jgi:hypothetical protein